MKGKVNVKATKTSATLWDAPYSGRSDDQVVTVRVGLETVVTLQLGVKGTALRVIRKRVERVRNLGWAVTLPVTRKIGVVLFVAKSKRALKLVRFGRGLETPRIKVTRVNRWVIIVRL
jgi:hypothetical protein